MFRRTEFSQDRFTFFGFHNSIRNKLFSRLKSTSNLQRSWGAEVSKKERNYRKERCVGDFCITHACASLERRFSERINSTNQVDFEFIKISTCSFLFYDMSCFFYLRACSMHSLLSLYSSIEIPTFPLLIYSKIYFPFTFLLKSLLSLCFSLEISTFFLRFY